MAVEYDASDIDRRDQPLPRVPPAAGAGRRLPTAASDDEGLVTLMTLHNAKGLEYPIVFMIGLEEGVFPHSRALDEGGLEEERRLCYVGITRAERDLYLTYARTRTVFGARNYGVPSRFIGEIPAGLTDREEQTAPPRRRTRWAAFRARAHELGLSRARAGARTPTGSATTSCIRRSARASSPGSSPAGSSSSASAPTARSASSSPTSPRSASDRSWGPAVAAMIIDGRAVAARVREQVARRCRGADRGARPAARSGHDPRRRGSGLAGVRGQQAQGVRRGRDRRLPPPPAGRRHPGARWRTVIDECNADSAGQRHPAPASGAGRARRGRPDRADLAGQGRRRADPDQRRATGPGHAWPAAVHALRRDRAARRPRRGARGGGGGRRRAQRSRRQAGGRAAAGAQRDGDDLPLPHA